MVTQKDMMLMAHLRQNCRETLTKMSRVTKIPVSTLYDRLKQHEKHTIQKHTALVDFTKLGFNVKAHIYIKVDMGQRSQVQEFLKKQFQINSIYKVNSGFDFMIEGIFMHIKGMEDFLEKFEERFEVRNKEVYYVIEDIQREAFMSDPATLHMVVNQSSTCSM